MKFLCEQCKAKYQISDDKVAGKTVRMKCRKCGHMIEVRSEVTESSVAKALPTDQPARTAGTGLRTSLAPKAPAKPSRPQVPPTPKVPGAKTAPGAKAAPGVPPARPDALAGAFQKSVHKKEKDEESAAHELASASTTSEWYVAINGVPVGPVRVSELRRKASVGAVTEDSLVWQEGLEEWRPVRTVTELAQLVREAAATGRPSLAPGAPGSTPPPPSARAPQSVRPPASRSVAPPRPAAGAPRTADAPSARNNVVPFTGGGARFATAEKLELDEEADATSVQEMPAALRPAPHAAVAPPPPAAYAPPAPYGAPERSSLVTADPFAMPAPPPGAGASASPFNLSLPGPLTGPVLTPGLGLPGPATVPPPSVAAPLPRRPLPWIPIAMVAMAMSFGMVAAYAVFFRPATPPPVVIQMPSAAAPPAPAPAPAVSDEITEFPATADSAKPAGKGPVAARPPTTPAPGAPKVEGLGDLFGPGGGPNAGRAPTGTGGGGGTALSGDAIEGVVRAKSAGVRRNCWERGGSSASSVNVTCRVVISGNGQVQNVTASGSDPAVAKCIENSVRSWSFPATGGTTTVDIPFHFVRQ